jgi:Flp pilus assembly protein TadG
MRHVTLLARFLKDPTASVLPMLALAALPVFGAVGAAVDYSRVNATRTAFQAAIDSTALMLSKEAPTLDPAQVGPKANAYFNALFVRPEAYNVSITQTFTSPQQGSFSLTLSGSGTVDTTFARVIGYSSINFDASTTVVWGIRKLNLTLVLDNTGSMASNNKMTELKAAAHNLLTTLKNAAKEPGDILVSIVPFATDVNVGTEYVNAPWIDWSGGSDMWEENNGLCKNLNGSTNTNYSNKSSCQSSGRTWQPDPHSVWNGCVMDRTQNKDVTITAPMAGNDPTLFPAHQSQWCPVSLMTLKSVISDWSALNAKIDAMTPTGNTNTTIGLAWGWETLAPSGLFNAPEASPDLDKVMMTDGLNTQNRWTSSSSSIDSRTATICSNIKAANIRIYTVRVIEGNANLLRACATKPEMYFDVQDADQLNSAFSAIAQNLANLRIMK